MFNIKKGKEEDINEEEKKVAEKLKELREAADEPETEQPDYSMYSPVEQLSTDIAAHLAGVTAKRLHGILNGIRFDASLQLVARLDNSDSKTAVNMIQAVFLAHGMEHAAEELDILMDCEPYDDEVYNSFIDELFETEVIAFRAAEAWCLEEPDDAD